MTTWSQKEKEDKIYDLYVNQHKDVKDIAETLNIPEITIYVILKRLGVRFGDNKSRKKPVVVGDEKRLAEALKEKMLEIKKEFPDFNVDGAVKNLLDKRGIVPSKILQALKDPEKLDKTLVKLARSKVLFILNSMTPEVLADSTLTNKCQILPLLLDVASGKYPMQQDERKHVNIKYLQQNILVCIDTIQKSNPALAKEIKDKLDGIKKSIGGKSADTATVSTPPA